MLTNEEFFMLEQELKAQMFLFAEACKFHNTDFVDAIEEMSIDVNAEVNSA